MDTEEIIKKIVSCAYAVRGQLVQGFLENVYKNAMVIEMRDCGLTVETERPIEVIYKGIIVGEYRADIIVNDSVIIELKATHALTIANEVQLVNYLTALQIDNGLLINFGGEKIEIKRKYRKYIKEFK